MKSSLLAFSLLLVSSLAMAATPYAGQWKASFSGSDHGTCSGRIQPSGKLQGVCHGRDEGAHPFKVAGMVSGNQIRFGVARTGAQFDGYIKGDQGWGTWHNHGSTGTWKLSRY